MKKTIVTLLSFGLFLNLIGTVSTKKNFLRAPREQKPSITSPDAIVGSFKNNICDFSSVGPLIKKEIDELEKNLCDKFETTWDILGCETLIFQEDIPFVITEPGTYCLGENVFFDSGVAIEIDANHVTFNLNNYRINGQNNGSICIHGSNVSDISVIGGAVVNAQGVVFEDSKGIFVDKTVGIANRNWGFRFDNCSVLNLIVSPLGTSIDDIANPLAGNGLLINQCQSVVLRDSKMACCQHNGINIIDSMSLSLEHIFIAVNGGSGILIDNTRELRLLDSASSSNLNFGYLITTSLGNNGTESENIVFEKVLADNNAMSGIGLVQLLPNTLINSVILQNIESIENMQNGLVLTGTNIVTRNNVIINNTQSGILANSFNSQILSSSLLGNGQDGIRLSTLATNMQVSENKIGGNGVTGINDTSAGANGHQILNNIATFNPTNYSAGIPFVLNPTAGDPLFGDSRDLVANIQN